MKKKPAKTNAVRLLDKHSIDYELREYPVDENDLSAEYVADKIGMPYAQVFKTLMVIGDKTGGFMVCIPTGVDLDLKKCASVSGNKKIHMAPLKDILALTGYIRGGVSPLGTKKPYDVYMDVSAFEWPVISLSAGKRGCQMLVNPADLGKLIDLKQGDLKHDR